jgi:hypothetical protein
MTGCNPLPVGGKQDKEQPGSDCMIRIGLFCLLWRELYSVPNCEEISQILNI